MNAEVTRQVRVYADRLCFACPQAFCGKPVRAARTPAVLSGRALAWTCPHCRSGQTIRFLGGLRPAPTPRPRQRSLFDGLED